MNTLSPIIGIRNSSIILCNKLKLRTSFTILYKTFLHLLTNALEQKVVVDKQREIYFIDNVKFHIDKVQGLGNFVEIEAIDNDGSIGKEKLQEQCRYFMGLLEISEEDLMAESYSDMLLG